MNRRRTMAMMTPKERALYDARADEEAWEFVLEILRPWVESARPIGSEELTRVMEGALAEAEQEHNRAADERKAAKAAL
jgi:DNA-binding MarR family transcriptional regulator